eukprot:GHVT01009756.1.p1 GENE.GHVT01009756.1~~GHVT01009756.1.p1  ORF type:complete len:762 (-),score=210.01 GHVT01009756.1:713-2974(-)
MNYPRVECSCLLASLAVTSPALCAAPSPPPFSSSSSSSPGVPASGLSFPFWLFPFRAAPPSSSSAPSSGVPRWLAAPLALVPSPIWRAWQVASALLLLVVLASICFRLVARLALRRKLALRQRARASDKQEEPREEPREEAREEKTDEDAGGRLRRMKSHDPLHWTANLAADLRLVVLVIGEVFYNLLLKARLLLFAILFLLFSAETRNFKFLIQKAARKRTNFQGDTQQREMDGRQQGGMDGRQQGEMEGRQQGESLGDGRSAEASKGPPPPLKEVELAAVPSLGVGGEGLGKLEGVEGGPVVVARKNLIFIRHGESVWNFACNRGLNVGLFFRLFFFGCYETVLACERDSVLLDSPLSTLGISQACELRRWLAHQASRRPVSAAVSASGAPAVSQSNSPTVSPISPTVSPISPAVSPISPAVSSVPPAVSSISPAVSSISPAVSSISPAVSSISPAVSSISPAVSSVSPAMAAPAGGGAMYEACHSPNNASPGSLAAAVISKFLKQPSRLSSPSLLQAARGAEANQEDFELQEREPLPDNQVSSCSSAADMEGFVASILRGEAAPGGVTFVASNLRRAISTLLIIVGERLLRSEHRVKVLTMLQEATRNPDGISSICGPNERPWLSQLELCLRALQVAPMYQQLLDLGKCKGNKTLRDLLSDRLYEFGRWSFSDSAGTIVVSGHSGWFKSFFQLFMQPGVDHIAKTRKIVNCGVVQCVLLKLRYSDGSEDFAVDPSSLRVVYGGFQGPLSS